MVGSERSLRSLSPPTGRLVPGGTDADTQRTDAG